MEERAARETGPVRRRRLEERTRHLKSKRFRKIGGVVTQIAGEIVKLAMEYKAAVVVDKIEDESYWELREGDGDGEKKHLLDGLGQLRKRLQELAQWYGLPYLELYSTVCLRYGAKLQELKNRKTTCPSYSFNDHKDNIPSIWAKRRY
ncbi:transposase [Pyrobaculum islandicum]|uniref:transposase n=1 Tax=Pyrobaculum islandicum TaxID=2277 RepID=UPI000A78CE8E